MKFLKNSNDPTYYNLLTALRENSRYEICRLKDGKVSFTYRRPRKDSRYWDDSEYMVWDLERNEVA